MNDLLPPMFSTQSFPHGRKMSIPRDHHYLPEFYLERWRQNGHVVRYVRRGKEGALEVKHKVPKGIAYQRDLYQLPDIVDPVFSQEIERVFFQMIDDGAATALRCFDAGEELNRDEREALCRFVVSLLYRSPSSLSALRQHIERCSDVPFQHLTGSDLDHALKSLTNRLMYLLIDSDQATQLLNHLTPHRIIVPRGTEAFLTSDRPVTLSAQLTSDEAFMLLPYGPDRLIVFSKSTRIVNSFVKQMPNNLVRGVNSAVIEQGEVLVVAADNHARSMVECLFLRRQPGITVDSLGHIRRKAPLVGISRWPLTMTPVRKLRRHV